MTKNPNHYPRVALERCNKLANLALSRIFRRHNVDLTREQESILRELNVLDGVNQVDLAYRTGQDRNNLSRTLSLLESKGCITRQTCDMDKRNSLVSITPLGRALHAEADKAMEQCRQVLFKGFSSQEAARFAESIERLVGNLEEYADQEPPSPGRVNPCREQQAARRKARAEENSETAAV